MQKLISDFAKSDIRGDQITSQKDPRKSAQTSSIRVTISISAIDFI